MYDSKNTKKCIIDCATCVSLHTQLEFPFAISNILQLLNVHNLVEIQDFPYQFHNQTRPSISAVPSWLLILFYPSILLSNSAITDSSYPAIHLSVCPSIHPCSHCPGIATSTPSCIDGMGIVQSPVCVYIHLPVHLSIQFRSVIITPVTRFDTEFVIISLLLTP